ncbi:MAG: AAA family ATPase [Bacteroidota bacterium]|nr:AAA family ATPase [Bacteroidota bacterium]MDP4212784.1 AAA family ATPase [Bacteroidota bacterium]MDP4250876.1 AAA family ATPase [Bacteroidota bacterium]
MIVIVFGLPGSGKSYFAHHLADRLRADYIGSDQLRKSLFTETIYSEKEKLLVYSKMLMEMREHVRQGKNLVCDATFYRNDIRRQFVDEAGRQNEIFFIEIWAAEPVIRRRLAQIRADSDADFEVYQKIKTEWEPMEERHLTLESTDNNISDMLNKAASYLHLHNDKRANQ